MPAAAQGLVECHETGRGLAPRLDEPVFGFQLRALGVEYVQEVGRAAVVTQLRELCGTFAGLYGFAQQIEALPVPAVGNKRVLGFFQRAQNGLLVAGKRAVGAGA